MSTSVPPPRGGQQEATRTMSSTTATRPGAGAKNAADGSDADAPKKKSKKKLLIMVLVVVLVAAGAAYWFLFRGGDAEAAVEPEPEKGEVVALESVSINLAGGHYLKLGLALQQTADAAHAAEGSAALDAAIALYSGREMSELQDPTRREELKEELAHTVEELYHHEVVDVYLTEYVMQ